MTKLSDLTTPSMRERIRNAWPFPIDAEPVLDGERPEPIRMPAFDVGQRVLVGPTPGSADPVLKKGGPGTVAYLRPVNIPGKPPITMVHVLVDGQQSATPEAYHTCELQAEPTV